MYHSAYVRKESSSGRVYPECNFVAWGKPIQEKCPDCGSSYLIEKVAESGSGGGMPEWRMQVQEAAGGAGGSSGVDDIRSCTRGGNRRGPASKSAVAARRFRAASGISHPSRLNVQVMFPRGADQRNMDAGVVLIVRAHPVGFR